MNETNLQSGRHSQISHWSRQRWKISGFPTRGRRPLRGHQSAIGLIIFRKLHKNQDILRPAPPPPRTANPITIEKVCTDLYKVFTLYRDTQYIDLNIGSFSVNTLLRTKFSRFHLLPRNNDRKMLQTYQLHVIKGHKN